MVSKDGLEFQTPWEQGCLRGSPSQALCGKFLPWMDLHARAGAAVEGSVRVILPEGEFMASW